tara:strand:- start:48 stop:491 length:444 start_codon:yes stop_codon:yes gene_type:complete
MKTYKQFCENAILNNPVVRNIVGRTGLGKITRAAAGQVAATFSDNKLAQDAVDVGTAGLGFGPAAPLAALATAGSKVYGPLATKVGRAKSDNQAATSNSVIKGLVRSPSVQKKKPTPGDIEKMTQDYMKTVKGVNGPLYGSSYRRGV